VEGVPIYEYKCLKCGKVFEAIEKVTQKSSTRCKFCKGSVERLISNSSFQLKGSGWYKTDYAPKSGGSEKSSESGDKSGEKSGDKPGEKSTDKQGDKAESSKKPESPDKGKAKKES
jgi:putative FmdB family regulatory protein